MSLPPRSPSPDRDPTFDAAWKAHSTELPPKHLDAAILAAAHREVGTRPRAAGDDEHIADARAPSRAWWGIAAAATIGAIAFGVLQLSPPPLPGDPSTTVATDMPRDTAERAPAVAALRDAPATFAEAQPPPGAESKPKPDALVARREADRRPARALDADPAPTAAPPANAQKPSEPRQRRADAPEREASVASGAGTLTEAPPAASRPPATSETAAATPTPFPGGTTAPSPLAVPASPPAPAQLPPAELAKAEADRSAGYALRRESRDRNAAPTLSQPAPQAARRAQAESDAQRGASAPAAKLQVRSPAAWIERIRALYVEQRFTDAARELNAFRDAHPDADARLPVELQTWAANIKRN